MSEDIIIPSRDRVRQLDTRWCLAILLLTIAFSIGVRIRLADMPLERDEGEYAYAGQLMLQGIPPYKLAYNMKLPGTYAAYAVIMTTFGQSPRGIHLGLMVVNALTTVLIYLLGRRLFGPISGLVAAACFAVLSLDPSVLGLAAHATHFVTLFAVAGALLIARPEDRTRSGNIFWSGLLFGISILMKQQAFCFAIFGALWIVAETWPVGKRKHLLQRTITFTAGVILPFALVCLILTFAGVFSQFWFWTISYASQYASETTLGHGLWNFSSEVRSLFHSAPLLWLAFLGATLVLLFDRAASRSSRYFSIGFLAAAFASACPGLYFRPHYFIPLLAGVAIVIGAAVEALWNRPRPYQFTGRACIVALLLAMFGQALTRHAKLFFTWDPDTAVRAIYFPNPFPEAPVIARYIQEHSNPGAIIAVIGSEPEIYFYSQRHSATGYIYTYGLMESTPYALRMQREMIEEVERADPDFLILVHVAPSWLEQRYSYRLILQWADAYAQRMQSVGLINIRPEGTKYHWEDGMEIGNPTSNFFIRVFRKSAAH